MEMIAAGDLGQIVTTRLWFGSWLPDWRPNVDYRETYSARADLGGGILLDAIHELDLLLWMAHDEDDFDVIGAVLDRLGPLDIDVEDTAHALLRHVDGWTAEVALDYLSRQYRRGVEIVGTEATARLDWARKVLEREANGHVEVRTADVPVDRSYEIEAARFLAFVDGGEAPPVDGIVGLRSLRLSERIREAAR
jgi:predicted dehydrogenase